eukprot:1203213-Rhodomonas_salina.1
MELPEQCFLDYKNELEVVQKDGKAGEQADAPPPPNAEASVADQKKLELRVRFKLKGAPSSISSSAKAGAIPMPVSVVKDRWVEKRYHYGDKELAPSDGKGHGIIFTTLRSPGYSGFPVPRNKLKWVKFPITHPPLFEGRNEIEGFPVLMVSTEILRITFDNFNRKAANKYAKYADFPPPPEAVTIVESGAGTKLEDIRHIVADQCCLPHWTPFQFTTRLRDDEGTFREQALKQDLGEMKSLSGQTSLVDVHLPGREEVTQALIDNGASSFAWVRDIVSVDLRPITSVMTEIRDSTRRGVHRSGRAGQLAPEQSVADLSPASAHYAAAAPCRTQHLSVSDQRRRVWESAVAHPARRVPQGEAAPADPGQDRPANGVGPRAPARPWHVASGPQAAQPPRQAPATQPHLRRCGGLQRARVAAPARQPLRLEPLQRLRGRESETQRDAR